MKQPILATTIYILATYGSPVPAIVSTHEERKLERIVRSEGNMNNRIPKAPRTIGKSQMQYQQPPIYKTPR